MKRTKWTPKRLLLLFSVLLAVGLLTWCFLPFSLIIPYFAFRTWLEAWDDDDYGYTSDGKFDWHIWD